MSEIIQGVKNKQEEQYVLNLEIYYGIDSLKKVGSINRKLMRYCDFFNISETDRKEMQQIALSEITKIKPLLNAKREGKLSQAVKKYYNAQFGRALQMK